MSRHVFPALSLTGLLVGLLLMACPPARAADRANIEAFLKVTGFDAALDSIAFAAADAPRLLGREPGDFGHDWTRVSREVFDTGRMREMAIDILGQTLSDELLGHAAAFYATPLGKRLVAAENASHLDEDAEARRARGRALLAQDRARGGHRTRLFRRMGAAIDSSGQAVRAVEEITVRFLMAASAAGVLEQRIDEATLRRLLRAQEAEMRAEMEEGALADAAATYRDFTDAELATYAEALEDPRMRRLYELMNAVQYEIMANRFEVLARRMADLHPGEEL